MNTIENGKRVGEGGGKFGRGYCFYDVRIPVFGEPHLCVRRTSSLPSENLISVVREPHLCIQRTSSLRSENFISASREPHLCVGRTSSLKCKKRIFETQVRDDVKKCSFGFITLIFIGALSSQDSLYVFRPYSLIE
jgi:hypothetical protein